MLQIWAKWLLACYKWKSIFRFQLWEMKVLNPTQDLITKDSQTPFNFLTHDPSLFHQACPVLILISLSSLLNYFRFTTQKWAFFLTFRRAFIILLFNFSLLEVGKTHVQLWICGVFKWIHLHDIINLFSLQQFFFVSFLIWSKTPLFWIEMFFYLIIVKCEILALFSYY